ncbi:MAG: 50S ribosomal protein L35ae [Candidatus Micrarchaeia archaeon]
MEGVIVNYRRSLHNARTNQYVVEVAGIATKEKAAALAGKKVVWTCADKSKKIGKVTHAHGNKGKVLARFESGLPGSAVGTKVSIA